MLFVFENRRSGTKGIVDFSLDPIVYELQKANRESLEFCWMMKLPWRREKTIAICRVQKDPCPIFQIWEKTLVAIFYLDPDSCFPERHKVTEKFEKSCQMQENLCPIFWECLKTLTEFFPVWENQKVFWGWKKSVRLQRKVFITVRQGMWYMRVGPSEKMNERS